MKTWPLTGVSIGAEFPAYPTRRVFTVHSDQGDFVVKVEPAPGPGLRSDEQLYVLEYLADHGFAHGPSVLRTRSGQRGWHTERGTVHVLDFVPHPLDPHPESRMSTWREFGRAAAALNAHQDYPFQFAVPIRATVDELERRAAGQAFEQPFRRLLTRAAQIEQLPACNLVHGEINEANARRRADGTVVLVDWDQAGAAPAVLEYGYPLIHVLVSEDLIFDAGIATAFYRGYLDAGGAIDRRQVFNAALFHALRYMWWGDTRLRWERIVYAVDHEDEICGALP